MGDNRHFPYFTNSPPTSENKHQKSHENHLMTNPFFRTSYPQLPLRLPQAALGT